jgi:hypothetical protein
MSGAPAQDIRRPARSDEMFWIGWGALSHPRVILDVVDGQALQVVGRMRSPPLIPALMRPIEEGSDALPVPSKDVVPNLGGDRVRMPAARRVR